MGTSWLSWQLVRWIGTGVLALGLSLYLTPLVKRGALRFGVLDQPDGFLKTHARATPYLGGVAVYVAFLVTLALVFEFRHALLALLLGGTMMTMLGLFDDLRVLPARLKLIGQALATWVMIKGGVTIALVAIPDSLILPLTVLWVVGMTNAVNILDVADGLATATSAIAATALACLALYNGSGLIAITALALAGALAGFLRYNRPNAEIYLGDAGSLFIGFMLASLAMMGSYTRHTPLAGLAPLFILATPILELGLVSVARLARGQSPMQGSPDHMATRLQRRGWGANQVLVFGVGLSGIGAVCGIGLVLAQSLTTAVVLAASGFAAYCAAWAWLYFGCPAPLPQPTPDSAQH